MKGKLAPVQRSHPAFLPAGVAAALLGLGAAAGAQPVVTPPATNTPPSGVRPPATPLRDAAGTPATTVPDPGQQPGVEPRSGALPAPTTPPSDSRIIALDLPETSQEPTTTLIESQIPFLPWLPDDALPVPDWATQNPPQSPFLRPGLGTSTLGGGMLPSAPPPRREAGVTPPLRLGPLDLRPSLDYRAVYGTGLLSGPGREESTWVQTITPGLALFAGDHWTLNYAPAIRLFSAEEYENSVDHTINLGGWATWQAWRFSLNHVSAITSDPLIETARQTDQVTHSTGLGAIWGFRPRSELSFSISQSIRMSEETSTGLEDPDYFAWGGQAWYDHEIRPKLKIGVGLGGGYDMVDPGTDMVNERVNVRASGPLGNKLKYLVSAGVEFRQFIDTDASTAVSPLASASLSYQVLQKTLLSLGMSHDVGASYFADQFNEATSVQAGLNQVLTPRWSAAASGGYRFSSYQSTFAGTAEQREDNSTFANVSLTGRIFPQVNLSLFYHFSSNGSDQSDFDFDSHQVGVRLNWTL